MSMLRFKYSNTNEYYNNSVFTSYQNAELYLFDLGFVFVKEKHQSYWQLTKDNSIKIRIAQENELPELVLKIANIISQSNNFNIVQINDNKDTIIIRTDNNNLVIKTFLLNEDSISIGKYGNLKEI